MAARFAPVDLAVDVTPLPENERQTLARLVQAAKVFDALFLRQVWEGNESMLLDLTRELGGHLVDALKTTIVQDQRCMTTWVLRKSA